MREGELHLASIEDRIFRMKKEKELKTSRIFHDVRWPKFFFEDIQTICDCTILKTLEKGYDQLNEDQQGLDSLEIITSIPRVGRLEMLLSGKNRIFM